MTHFIAFLAGIAFAAICAYVFVRVGGKLLTEDKE